MFVSTSWLVAAGNETTCLVFSRMVAYSWGKMAFEQPNSNPSTPPFSTHLIHNFRLYLIPIENSTIWDVIKGYDQDGGVASCTPSAVACLEGLVSNPEICFADESDRVK